MSLLKHAESWPDDPLGGSAVKRLLLCIQAAAPFLALPLALTACMSITPASQPTVQRVSRPVFDEVSVSGLGFYDERVTGRSEGEMESYGSSVASANVGGMYGSAVGTSFGAAHASSRTLKTFENWELQDTLRRSLEESGLTRRVVGKAPIRIDGMVDGEADTGAGRILFNVFNTIPFFGTLPYLGSTRAWAELRLYQNDELVHTWRGTGRSNWSRNIFLTQIWALASEIHQVRNRSKVIAAHLAVQDAVAQMSADSDRIAALRPAAAEAPAMDAAPTVEKVGFLCEQRWPADARRRAQCTRQQRDAFTRMGPELSGMESASSTEESKALRSCHAAAQLPHGTDWEMFEDCYLAHTAPTASRGMGR
jgi:hypothetical protein